MPLTPDQLDYIARKNLSPERLKIILNYQREIKRLQKEADKIPEGLRRDIWRIVDNRRARISQLILETVDDPKSPLPPRSAAGLGRRIAGEVNIMIEEMNAAVAAGQSEAFKAGAKAGNELLRAVTLDSASTFSPSAELLAIAQKHSADLIVTIGRELIPKVNASIARGVLGGLTPFEVMKDIDRLVGNRVSGGGASYQAERIVRTEVNRVYSITIDQFNGALVDKLGPKAASKLKKRWVFGIWREGRRESHLEMDGEEVPINETFSNGLKYPRDPGAWDKPEEVINCACSWVIVPDSVEEAALAAIGAL